MYEAYWKLSQKPFTQRQDPSRFYRSKSHQTALLRLNYAIDNLTGPGLILGASGTGKTALVKLLSADSSGLQPFIHIVFPAISPDDLLRHVAGEVATFAAISPVLSTGNDGVLREIVNSLRRLASTGHRPLICFDDAHLLSEESLEQVVQPLLNLAEADDSALLSVLLVGQPVCCSPADVPTSSQLMPCRDFLKSLPATPDASIDSVIWHCWSAMRNNWARSPLAKLMPYPQNSCLLRPDKAQVSGMRPLARTRTRMVQKQMT